PLCHITAAKAVCLYEASQPEFKTYIKQLLDNCQVLAETLRSAGFRLVTGGTDNHLILVDTMSMGVTGRDAETALDRVHITVNKNSIPFDQLKPSVTSGIRVGTAAMTTRGFKEAEFRRVGEWIAEVLNHKDDENVLSRVAAEVVELTSRFPLE
ncbi:MAG TPA: serine hydroxymethyltransferase, partial [Erysipelotrichaceae bacterium]|nr:serine hydroxymethyltransferase [Erysipelotrichaceae bacterium]